MFTRGYHPILCGRNRLEQMLLAFIGIYMAHWLFPVFRKLWISNWTDLRHANITCKPIQVYPFLVYEKHQSHWIIESPMFCHVLSHCSFLLRVFTIKKKTPSWSLHQISSSQRRRCTLPSTAAVAWHVASTCPSSPWSPRIRLTDPVTMPKAMGARPAWGWWCWSNHGKRA